MFAFITCRGKLSAVQVGLTSKTQEVSPFFLYNSFCQVCYHKCILCIQVCQRHLALPLQCAHVWSLVKHHFRPNFSRWKTFACNFTGAVNLQWASTLCRQLRTCLMLFSALHDLPNRVYIGMQELLLLQSGESSHVCDGHFSFFTFVHRL